MRQPHLHHILSVNGRRGEERALIREGQAILNDVGINPLKDREVLVWAPNKGHTVAETRMLVERLRLAENKAQVVSILDQFGKRASGR